MIAPTRRPARRIARHLAVAVALGTLTVPVSGAVVASSASAATRRGVGPVTNAAAVAAPAHAGLVPAKPATGYPVIRSITDGGGRDRYRVYAVNQVGRLIAAGGDFQEVELADGTVVARPYFTAWNIDTKQLECTSTTFDNEVLAIVPGDTPDSFFVAGRFAKITGPDGVVRVRNRVAKLRMPGCTVDPTFTSPTPNAKLDELALAGGRLFVGGDFTTIGGRAISTLAQLDATTGAVSPAFSLGFSGGLTSKVKALATDPAGTRLYVAGRFGTASLGGVSVAAPTAVVDISGMSPVLTRHATTGIATPIQDLTEAGVAADGSAIALTYGTATKSDYVYLANTTEAPGAVRWAHYIRDSSFGVAVTPAAVYVGGHFCKPDAGPGTSDVMAPVPGIASDCTGTQMAGGVWRSHIAALSPSDGTPLAWNPGNASYHGAEALTATPRGLLVGYDGERTAQLRVGAVAFFDFGAAVEGSLPPSAVTLTSPAPGATVGNPLVVTGTATDDVAVASFRVALRAADGTYLQADGSLAAARYEFAPPADGLGGFRLSTSPPVGTWTIEAVAVDVTGRVSADVTTRSVTENGADNLAPVVAMTPPAGLVAGSTATVTGTVSDDVAVTGLAVRVRNNDAQWLQPGGGFSATPADLPVTLAAALPVASTGWTLALGTALPVGPYVVEARAVDGRGNPTTLRKPFSVQLVDGPCPTLVTGWWTQLYANTTLSGTPAVCRDDATLAFDWGTGAPAAGLPVDGFSSRFTSVRSFPAGTFTFTTTTDDGVRLWVDGTRVVDSWVGGLQTRTATLTFATAAPHRIVLEQYDSTGGARASLTWAAVAGPVCPATISGWKGEYFANTTLSGAPAICRDDAAVNFDWGTGSPQAGSVPSDNFTARWTRTLSFAAGTYRFAAGADDGVRLYVDGVRVVDSWIATAYRVRTADVTLTAGPHTVVMEYLEQGGSARATLSWATV